MIRQISLEPLRFQPHSAGLSILNHNLKVHDINVQPSSANFSRDRDREQTGGLPLCSILTVSQKCGSEDLLTIWVLGACCLRYEAVSGPGHLGTHCGFVDMYKR